mmetsp:Transcript_20092/g.51243  ORF Transcript_20092/g.51243 Transcript_20092/m.51243 type:complete len:340 (-) Transcript_20092:1339-2358(-)
MHRAGELLTATEGEVAFPKLRVAVKQKVVNEGDSNSKDEDVSATLGTYLSPSAWFAELNNSSSGSSLLWDCRNSYETELGSFVPAQSINTLTFRDTFQALERRAVQDGVNIQGSKWNTKKKFLLFCTGGIRCVKVANWMVQDKGLSQEQVLVLDGGVVAYANYLRSMQDEDRLVSVATRFRLSACSHNVNKKSKSSIWKGRNFVFDNRMEVDIQKSSEDHPLQTETISRCHYCGKLWGYFSNCTNSFCRSLIIQCPSCAKQYSQACTPSCTAVVRGHATEKRWKCSGSSFYFKRTLHPRIRQVHRISPRPDNYSISGVTCSSSALWTQRNVTLHPWRRH